MEYLTKHGVRFGENGISRTSSCHGRLHTYYLCESRVNMDKHYDYERSVGIKPPVKKKKNKYGKR